MHGAACLFNTNTLTDFSSEIRRAISERRNIGKKKIKKYFECFQIQFGRRVVGPDKNGILGENADQVGI